MADPTWTSVGALSVQRLSELVLLEEVDCV